MNRDSRNDSVVGGAIKKAAVGGVVYAGALAFSTTDTVGRMLEEAYTKEGGPGMIAKGVNAVRDHAANMSAEAGMRNYARQSIKLGTTPSGGGLVSTSALKAGEKAAFLEEALPKAKEYMRESISPWKHKANYKKGTAKVLEKGADAAQKMLNETSSRMTDIAGEAVKVIKKL